MQYFITVILVLLLKERKQFLQWCWWWRKHCQAHLPKIVHWCLIALHCVDSKGYIHITFILIKNKCLCLLSCFNCIYQHTVQIEICFIQLLQCCKKVFAPFLIFIIFWIFVALECFRSPNNFYILILDKYNLSKY